MKDKEKTIYRVKFEIFLNVGATSEKEAEMKAVDEIMTKISCNSLNYIGVIDLGITEKNYKLLMKKLHKENVIEKLLGIEDIDFGNAKKIIILNSEDLKLEEDDED